MLSDSVSDQVLLPDAGRLGRVGAVLDGPVDVALPESEGHRRVTTEVARGLPGAEDPSHIRNQDVRGPSPSGEKEPRLLHRAQTRVTSEDIDVIAEEVVARDLVTTELTTHKCVHLGSLN